jgi:hypothetical protein
MLNGGVKVVGVEQGPPWVPYSNWNCEVAVLAEVTCQPQRKIVVVVVPVMTEVVVADATLTDAVLLQRIWFGGPTGVWEKPGIDKRIDPRNPPRSRRRRRGRRMAYSSVHEIEPVRTFPPTVVELKLAQICPVVVPSAMVGGLTRFSISFDQSK